MHNISSKSLDKSLFNEKQLKQISIGIKKGINYSWYANPEFSHAQMCELRFALQYNLSDLEMKFLANPLWSNEQIREIRLGMIENIDYMIYAFPEYNASKMRRIRMDLANSEEI